MTTANLPVWGNGLWTDLPSLRGEAAADVCVVGLGGSGLSCILDLLDRGLSVVGVDARGVGGGAAGRNGGFLLAGTASFYHHAAAAFGAARIRRIYALTVAQIDRMTAETPQAIRRTGSCRIAASATELEDCVAQLEAMRADGILAETYEGPEGRGLLVRSDGAFEPLVRCRALARKALAAGAQLFERSPVGDVSARGVVTPTGRVSCARTVVAVDGGLECVLPELVGRVRSARLQMLATAPTDEISVARPIYRRWGFDYWQQLPDRRVVLGGFRDRGGQGEWTTDARPSAIVQDALEDFLRSTLGVHAPITHRWAAIVSYSTTGLPVLEEVRRGVFAVGAYSGTGNVLGALCGRGAAALAADDHCEIADVLSDNQ